MFMTDSQVEQMTGIKRETHRPSTLRKWLEDHGWRHDIDFFERRDGWYSVVAPAARAMPESRPRLRLPA